MWKCEPCWTGVGVPWGPFPAARPGPDHRTLREVKVPVGAPPPGGSLTLAWTVPMLSFAGRCLGGKTDDALRGKRNEYFNLQVTGERRGGSVQGGGHVTSWPRPPADAHSTGRRCKVWITHGEGCTGKLLFYITIRVKRNNDSNINKLLYCTTNIDKKWLTEKHRGSLIESEFNIQAPHESSKASSKHISAPWVNSTLAQINIKPKFTVVHMLLSISACLQSCNNKTWQQWS